jgi:hypothetical protein
MLTHYCTKYLSHVGENKFYPKYNTNDLDDIFGKNARLQIRLQPNQKNQQLTLDAQ